MSNASRCSRYYARRRALEAQLLAEVADLKAEIFRLKEHVNMVEKQNQELIDRVNMKGQHVNTHVNAKIVQKQRHRQSGGRARVEDESLSLESSGTKKEKKENSDSVASLEFERFWRVYPSRRPYPNPKAAAAKKFDVAVRHGADPELLIAAAERYARLCQGRDPQYVVQTTRWFNEKRWEDEIQALRRSEPVRHYPIGMS